KRPLQKDEYVRQLELENDVLKKVVGNPEQGGMNAKHQMVQELRDRYTIQDLCRYLKISRSRYYRYLKRRDGMNPKEKDLKEKIHSIYQQRKGTYGYRRIQVELQRQFGIRVNHKRVLRL